VADFPVAGSAALTLVTGVTPLRVEPALFEAMLSGWRTQQQSRRLSGSIIGQGDRTVRRFAEFTGGWPWSWSPGQVEAWIASGGWAHSTVRSYQGAVAVFLEYVCDNRYGWVAECEQRVKALLKIWLARSREERVAGAVQARARRSSSRYRANERRGARGDELSFIETNWTKAAVRMPCTRTPGSPLE